MEGDLGHTGGLITSGAEDAEPVIQIPVGLPFFERERLVKKAVVFVEWVNCSYLIEDSLMALCVN